MIKINKPFFSIIIATFNAEKHLDGCLNSIFSQSYKNYELIVIDGKSNDRTIEILKKYQNGINFFVSEVDNGIYDAWNKGIKLSNGDWIMFVGADDLLNSDVLLNYNKLLDKEDMNFLDFVSGKVELVTENLIKIRNWGWEWEWNEFRRKIRLAHTTSLHSRAYFGAYGLFDSSYKIAGDYEILMRAKSNLRTLYVGFITGKQRIGGISSSSKVFFEVRRLMIRTGEESIWFANIQFIKNYSIFLIKNFFNYFKIKTFIRNA